MLALCASLVYYGVYWVRTNVEIATLRVSGTSTDYYPRVLVAEEPPSIWVRAERPDRLWLAALRLHPDVTVRRAGVDYAYHAHIWDQDFDRERVDRMFSAKYGAIDRVSAWFWRRNAVPIRLDPRGDFADAQRSTTTLPIE